MSLDHLATSLDIKTVSDQRIISGHAAAWSLDRVGDTIDSKAFDRTLREKAPGDVAVFIGHDQSQLPVGIPTVIRPDAHGLYTEVKVFDGPAGDNLLAVARGLKAAGQTLGLSIGYRVRDSKMERLGSQVIRKLLDIDLVEFSYAARQSVANPAALMTSVKRLDGKQGAVGTFDFIRMAVMRALNAAYPDRWCRIEDIDSQYVFYSCEGSGGSIGGYWRASYSQDGDGPAALSNPVPVVPDWHVIAASAEEDDGMDMAKALSSSSDAAGGYLVEPDGGKFWVTKNGKRMRAFGTLAEARAHMASMEKTVPNSSEVTPVHPDALPDSAFFFVEPGGQLDAERKTVPRSNRHFSYRGEDGLVDLKALSAAVADIQTFGGLDTEAKASLLARARHIREASIEGKTLDQIETAEWKSGAALDIRGVAYELTDLSEQVATELKAMTLLGTDTRQNGRMRPELLNQLKALQIKLAGVIEHAEFITAEQDGAAMVAHYRRQLDLLEV